MTKSFKPARYQTRKPVPKHKHQNTPMDSLAHLLGFSIGTLSVVEASYRYRSDVKYPKNYIYITWRCSKCEREGVSDWQDFKHKHCCECARPLFWVSSGVIPKYFYDIFISMHARCYNEKCKAYKNYGARGINVCEEWDDLLSMYKDMGDRPTDEHSLDRIDNNKGYNKENCKWSTRREQAENRRGNKIELESSEGAKTKVSDLATLHGLSRHKIYNDVKKVLNNGDTHYLGYKILHTKVI